MKERAYCSDIARRDGEPLVGTASHALGCVLLSYPKRMWARNALVSDGLAAVGDAFDRLGDEDVVVRLVAHEGEWHERVEITRFPEARRWRDVALADVPEVLARQGGEPVTRPLITVCTHGVRDRCCALYGGALVTALRAVGNDVDVLEASHLGGDRFAPTVLVLPSGHMYGHLEPGDAPALIAAAGGGAVLRSRFRGSLWRDPLEQLAEVAAIDLGGTLAFVMRDDHDADHATLHCTITASGASIALDVQCVREHRLVVGDCRNADIDRRGSVHTWRIAHTTRR